ncbi:MAG: 2-phosphosulfolactate phosphatase [Phycisphaerae bacterium]|nr:2-phosphosulfolactate phosphatase [Phycisphaerae bacterium]
MIVDVVLLPDDLRLEHLSGRIVFVFDVLRATTTMTSALAAGAKEIRTFDTLEAAETAAMAFDGRKLLCGEKHTLPPPGFDLGNSPGDYTPEKVGGKTIFFATTNGTRAIHAAMNNPGAKPIAVYAAALVNASAAAAIALQEKEDVTLLCSGSDGQYSGEDLIGAGAVVHALGEFTSNSDMTFLARAVFSAVRDDLPAALRQTYGGRNNLRVGLGKDIDFAARLDVFQTVGKLTGDPATARVAK